jgi:CheY-like chemotaxis protein/anti-sigma regulatory factor (Ser/Thr protein kinase)
MTYVLVVDDSPVDRHLAGSLLKEHGSYTVAFAEHGGQALEQVSQTLPDIVVTDLQMPEVDGLALVQELKRLHPQVPVVLMTSQGSEAIAVQALKSGAASYLPKSRLSFELLQTIEDVLAVSRADRQSGRLNECITVSESRFTLENNLELVPPLVEHVRQEMLRVKLCDEGEMTRLGIALHESLVNAIDHGNLELSSDLKADDDSKYHELAKQRRQSPPYCERRVRVHVRITPDEARCSVADDGPGFDPTQLPDPTDPSNLERVFGRGLLLIRTFMDEVLHNERGNEITMIKRRKTV